MLTTTACCHAKRSTDACFRLRDAHLDVIAVQNFSHISQREQLDYPTQHGFSEFRLSTVPKTIVGEVLVSYIMYVAASQFNKVGNYVKKILQPCIHWIGF
jgi:hypothetical protein